MSTKVCARCKEVKDLEEFNRQASSKDGHGSWCRECNRAYVKKWQSHNGRTGPDSLYEEMLAKQGGVCAICLKPPEPDKRHALDHCHATGRYRGALCFSCNTGLGHFGDDIDRLKRAIEYLS